MHPKENLACQGSHNLDDDLFRILFLHRESNERHERYEEELDRFSAIHDGDSQKAKSIVETFRANTYSHLSDDPIRNRRYLFVVNATMATRFAIEGGVPMEIAYNISDLYIQRMDRCQNLDEINILLEAMIQTFVHQVNTYKHETKARNLSPAVLRGVEFIHNNLHDQLTLSQISKAVHLSPSYYSALFLKETGHTVTQYILQKKIAFACDMLQFTELSGAEIANFLGFASHSYFCKQFKLITKLTPENYRKQNFRNKWKNH